MDGAISLAWRGANVRYRRFGRGPTLMFLRCEDSLPDEVDFFESLARDFDVIVPDHPCFRDSNTPNWFKGIGDVAYFYLDFFQQLNLGGVHLVGSSLGGWIAAEIALRDYARFAPNFFHIPLELLFPPGYTSIRSLRAMLASRKGLADTRVTFDDRMARSNVIVGSAATVREKIEVVHAKTGFRIMVPMAQFGTLPDDPVKKSTQMFAQEVAPYLREL